MPRLPIPGQDIDQWGTLLNEFLQVAHRADGSLRSALQPFNVRNYGATGDGVTDDSAAIDAAQQAARGTGGAIYFPTGVYLIARNVQMTSPLHFEHGARIRPESGVTLLMDEEREASENDIPLQPAGIIAPEHAMIFDFTAGGSVEIRRRCRLYANWWSGDDIGAQWNSMVSGVRRFGDDSRFAIPRLFMIAPGVYDLRTPMDLTGFRSNQHFDFRGVQLRANLPRQCALDLTGSSGCTLWSPHLTAANCAIGLLESRPENDGASSGKHTIIAPHISGIFEIAAYYNCAAEETKIFGGRIENQQGKYTAYWGREVHPADRQAVTDATPHSQPGNSKPTPGAQSATGYNVFGTQIRGTTTSGTIYVWGFDRLSLAKVYATATTAPHLVIDISTWSCVGPFVDEIYCHGDKGGKPDTCIEIKGSRLNIEVAHFRLSARQLVASKHLIKIGPTELAFCDIRTQGHLLERVRVPGEPLPLPGCTYVRGDNTFAAIVCDPATRWVDSRIQLRQDDATPINLGGAFIRSALIMGNLSKFTAAQSMAGSTVRGLDVVPPAGVTESCVPEVRTYSHTGLASLTYDGYAVRGRKGPNLTATAEAPVTVADGCWYYLPSETLTANRTLKLSRDGAVVGNIISIVRADVSPHTFAVVDDGPGGETLQVLPGAQPSEARFRFNGSTWELQEYGEL